MLVEWDHFFEMDDFFNSAIVLIKPLHLVPLRYVRASCFRAVFSKLGYKDLLEIRENIPGVHNCFDQSR